MQLGLHLQDSMQLRFSGTVSLMIEITEFAKKLNFNQIIFFYWLFMYNACKAISIYIMYKILNMRGLNVAYRGIYGHMHAECILEKESRSVDFLCILI